MMTRRECETEIVKHLLIIQDIYNQYLTENGDEWRGRYDHLSCAVFKAEVSVFNSRYTHDEALPLNVQYDCGRCKYNRYGEI